MISLYYYLGVVVTMFMKESDHQWSDKIQLPAVAVSLGLAVIGSLGLGLFPSALMASFELFVSRLL